MQTLKQRLTRDPGAALAYLGGFLALLIYASVVSYSIVDYDDTWLVRDNFVLQRTSLSTLSTIFLDTSSATRFLLGAEYLPIRDVSVMLDFAVWGDWYGGHHLTNLLLYVLAIALWFRMLVRWGLPRTVVGLAILVWAIHPTHAESVAWLSERKGLLGLVWAGVAGLAYLRFRQGKPVIWIIVAAIATVFAVWSKALAAFTVAAFVGFEIVCDGRVSWRRSLAGLTVIGVAGVIAFIPVLKTAQSLSVITSEEEAPAGKLAMAIGGHGFYIEQALAASRNAIKYPIASQGPSALQIVIGALALLGLLCVAFVPRRGRWKPPVTLHAGAILWLLCWFPASRLVLPLKAVLFADRYALVGTLGLALVAATLLLRMRASRIRTALCTTVVVALCVRAFDAQSNWRSSTTLWQRATISDPRDGEAWSSYAEALENEGEDYLALDAVKNGLKHARSPRILHRKALLVLSHGERPVAVQAMREAAEAGEPRAMSNLSFLLLEDGKVEEALEWARRAVSTAPMYRSAYTNLGAAAIRAKRYEEALAAFQRAYELWPVSCSAQENLAVALARLKRREEARRYLEGCMFDPVVGTEVRALYVQLAR